MLEAGLGLKSTGLAWSFSEQSEVLPTRSLAWSPLVTGEKGKECGHRHTEVDAVKRQFIVY